ncbi:Methyl-accepting chemotaxis protein II [Stieleria bergensis]|uniref:Methyl-accepting chemotaxis protein II n=1 Tax=Stieleria bergensis TaxID=2528025 RepID=A0A517SZL5_9BACT|nr:Methyl-accepting chemotaxis protein II [Planctomycetes bacterium SV_7m_r]
MTTETTSNSFDDTQAQLDAIGRTQAVIEFDLDGNILDANQNFTDTVGYSLDEIVGQHHRMFVAPKYAESSDYKKFWKDLRNGHDHAGEFERFDTDGNVLWLRASYNPIIGPAGKPVKVVKYATDITESKLAAIEMVRVHSMMEQAPSNIMFADTDFIIRYLNPESEKTLRTIEEFLPIKVDDIVGQSIDIFHKDPSHQRRILADPSKLPIQAVIKVGPESLDLLVSPVFDQDKNFLGAMVTWDIITAQLKAEKEMARVSSMMEQAPINIMFADTDLIIRYANPASIRTLKAIEDLLPIRADELIGQCIDIFHKNPSHQRNMLKDPSNLPISTEIKLGDETLDLQVNAVFDQNKDYMGAMVSWEVITKRLAMEREIEEKAEQERARAQETQEKVDVVLTVVNAVAAGDFNQIVPDLGEDAVGQVGKALEKAIDSVRNSLKQVREVSSTVANAAQEMASASQEISTGAQEQASSLEETASSLEEITSTVKQNTDNAQQASDLATGSRDVAQRGGNVVSEAVEAMSAINSSSKKIADIITAIDEIAFQTNLLALNAAVEAARAGEQGRGFAVVAAEVRNLAQRSATAAKEIKSLIEDSSEKVENGTGLVNDSGSTLDEIVTSVKQVTEIITEIAAASSEQLTGIEQVNRAVAEMDRVTQSNATQTEEMSATAASLLSHAEQLNGVVARFRLDDGEPHLAGPATHQAPAPAGAPIAPISAPATMAANSFQEF